MTTNDEKKTTVKEVRILGFGYFRMPANPQEPYFVTLDAAGNGVGQNQPMSVVEFFKLLNNLCLPHVQPCGQTHVPTVNIPVVVTH